MDKMTDKFGRISSPKKSFAESIAMLVSQLDRVKKIPNSEELCHIISELPGMMGEVMDFIQEWLEHWTHT